jgi:hypothetical protein
MVLPHIDPKVLEPYRKAPGNELLSGRMTSPESSAALVANVFGYFAEETTAKLFPVCALITACHEPPISVSPERELRFPWNGGRHPWLDVVIETENWLIGIECKRYEPFRTGSSRPPLSEAHWRPVWGDRMGPFDWVRNSVKDGSLLTRHLDCAQLVKHAFGIRTQAQKLRTQAALAYVYAEPARWPEGRPISKADIAAHRAEVASLQASLSGAEVLFASVTYQALLKAFLVSPDHGAQRHAAIVREHFDI